MIVVDRPTVSASELAQQTGWQLRPEGACKGDRCVPLPREEDGSLDLQVLGERLGMALVHDSEHGLWALGPESEGRALASSELPEITLPDRHGNPFSLHTLRGSKVLLVAWASW
jgi:hypothetical protein